MTPATKKAKKKPTIVAAVRELTRATRAQAEKIYLWEVSNRSCLTQLAKHIADFENVPALRARIASLELDLAALRIRMQVRRSEYAPEVAPEAGCDQNGTASASSATE